MTQVTFDETQAVAQKAKLTFTREQLERIQKDLQSLLEYAAQLEKVDTSHVPGKGKQS